VSRTDALARLARAGALAWMPTLVLGLVGWWAMMVWVPEARAHFLPPSQGDFALWAFVLADLFLVGLPTGYAASLVLRGDDEAIAQARWTAWLVTGALGYSALWSLGASLVAWSAPLGPMLMLACAFVQAVVAWTLQPVVQWFRVAEPASNGVRALRTVGDAVLFTGAFLGVVPLLLRLLEDTYGLPRFEPVPWVPVAVAIVVLNAFGLVSGLWFVKEGDGTPLPVDTAGTLVVSGPYAWIRNPMAAAGIAQGILLAVALGSWITLVYSLFGGMFWHVFVRPIEEEDLERRFGAPYRAYVAAVPLWRPRLGPWRPEG
jgi:protein-S-isoprenylcysteine O-methyltransferase Ste14